MNPIEFSAAAVSYLGLPEGSHVSIDKWSIQVVMPLTPEDLVGIGRRAEEMARVKGQPEPQVEEPAAPGPTYEQVARNTESWVGQGVDEMIVDIGRLGREYDGLTAEQKSQHGSRFRYVVGRAREIDAVKAQAAVADEAPPVLPAYMWMAREDISQSQVFGSLSEDGKGRYAIAVDEMTTEQKIKYGVPTYPTATVPHVTSNADDFGGLPG